MKKCLVEFSDYLNVKDVPVVPGTFSAAYPPKQVLDKSSRFIVIEYLTLV